MIFRILIILTIILTAMAVAQQNEIPNPGFESWVGSSPDGWYINNPGGPGPMSQSTDAHSGSFALRGEVVNLFNNPYPPVFWAGTITNQLIPISSNYDHFSGYYKYAPANNDTFFISVNIFDASSNLLGNGFVVIGEAAASYTAFDAPIVYGQSGVAAFAAITSVIVPPTGQTPAIGTVYHVDDLSFGGGAVGISEIAENRIPSSYALRQNYPNPFNPATTIEFSLPIATTATLQIYNPLGQVVATLVDQNLAAGSYRFEWSAENLPSGAYIYRLEAGSFSQSKKLILMK